MRDGDRPGPHAQPRGFRAPAEIDIVEIEGEALVEAHAAIEQRTASDGKKDTIQHHALQPRGTVSRRPSPGSVAVSDNAAQESALYRDEGILLLEPPGGLAGLAARVAGQADNVERLQGLPDAVVHEAIVQPHVVVDEEEHLVAVFFLDLAVVDRGQARAIVECDTDFQAPVVRNPPQRLAQGHGFHERPGGRARSGNDQKLLHAKSDHEKGIVPTGRGRLGHFPASCCPFGAAAYRNPDEPSSSTDEPELQGMGAPRGHLDLRS